MFLQYMLKRVRETNERCDELINTPSDYSIIIKDLPEVVTIRDISDLIEEHRKFLDQDILRATHNLAVRKIIIARSLREYLKEKQEQEEDFLKHKKDDEDDEKFIRQQIPKPTQNANFAIVVFDSQKAKDTFLSDTKSSFKNAFIACCHIKTLYEIKGEPAIVERAPEPDDILW